MKICLLTLYLNYFNENKLMFGRTLKKFFLIFLFFLISSNLRTSTYNFYKSTAARNFNSATFGTFLKKSEFCGRQICFFCRLRQHLRPLPLVALNFKKNYRQNIFIKCIAKRVPFFVSSEVFPILYNKRFICIYMRCMRCI